jgi:hypothetical protein
VQQLGRIADLFTPLFTLEPFSGQAAARNIQ